VRPLVLLILLLLASPSGAEDACTQRLRPGDDLQAAVDRLPERGGVLCLGAGDFRLPGALSITRDGVTLRGEGASTVLGLAPSPRVTSAAARAAASSTPSIRISATAPSWSAPARARRCVRST
jgi:hypothetical protein